MEKNVLGFDSNGVRELADSINTCRNNCLWNYQRIIQNEIINPVSDFWFAPEAKEYFNKFVIDAKQLSKLITTNFNSFIEFLNEQILLWITELNIEEATIPLMYANEVQLNTDAIRTIDDNGNQGILIEECKKYVANIPNIEKKIEEIFNQNQNQVRTYSVFKGSNQLMAINENYTAMLENLNSLFDSLATTIENYMNSTSVKYENLAKKTVSDMQNSGI